MTRQEAMEWCRREFLAGELGSDKAGLETARLVNKWNGFTPRQRQLVWEKVIKTYAEKEGQEDAGD